MIRTAASEVTFDSCTTPYRPHMLSHIIIRFNNRSLTNTWNNTAGTCWFMRILQLFSHKTALDSWISSSKYWLKAQSWSLHKRTTSVKWVWAGHVSEHSSTILLNRGFALSTVVRKLSHWPNSTLHVHHVSLTRLWNSSLWINPEQYLYSCEHPCGGYTEVQVGQRVRVWRLVQLRGLFLWQII